MIKINPREILFLKPEETITIYNKNKESYKLTVLNPYDQNLSDIRLEVDKKKIEIKKFAPKLNYESRFKFYSTFLYYYELKNKNSILLFGQFQIFIIKSDGRRKKILQLYREINDDKGFWSPFSVYEYRQNLIIHYETGVACISCDLKCNWHVKLRYDDLLIQTEKDKLIFLDNYNNIEWCLSLIDGRKNIIPFSL